MTNRLDNKVAIVTGGSRGIGKAIARRLAEEGADVAITYGSSAEAAEAFVAELREKGRKAIAIQADAADPEAAKRYVEQAELALGQPDILIHNAGIGGFGKIGDIDPEDFRRQFAVNVDGVFAGTNAIADKIADNGAIAIIGSVNAHTMPTAGGSIYAGTKAAVTGLARGWARDFGPRNIRVNVIQPGPVETDMNPSDGEYAKILTPMTALGRYGRPEEIAALAAFLVSDEASYITGACIDIDGGLSA